MADEIDKSLEQLIALLPQPLRKDWVVIPKRVLTQAVIVSMALGVAGTLMIVGFIQDNKALSWAWPGVTVALMLLARFLPWWRGDALEKQLSDATTASSPGPTGQHTD